MSKFEQLKQLVKQLETTDIKRRDLLQVVEDLEEEHIRNVFWINRQKQDIKVNENFVKKTVALLEDSNEALKKTNDELKNTNEKLEKSNGELERFAYIASHDLKTPLANIISFTVLLEKEIAGMNNPNVSQYLSFIKLGSTRLKNLITDVLEFSRLSSNAEEELEQIDLNALVKTITESISEYLKQRNAEIIIHNVLPCIKFNASKIFMLFKNLIENGIKYNESEAPTIQISAIEKEGCHQLLFQDNGIGIPEEMVPKIFKMFSRLHRNDQYEGTGLGLSTCQKIVESEGGKLRVRSQVGEGSTFIVELNPDCFISHDLQKVVCGNNV